jgi:hypothetical protein
MAAVGLGQASLDLTDTGHFRQAVSHARTILAGARTRNALPPDEATSGFGRARA